MEGFTGRKVWIKEVLAKGIGVTVGVVFKKRQQAQNKLIYPPHQ